MICPKCNQTNTTLMWWQDEKITVGYVILAVWVEEKNKPV